MAHWSWLFLYNVTFRNVRKPEWSWESRRYQWMIVFDSYRKDRFDYTKSKTRMLLIQWCVFLNRWSHKNFLIHIHDSWTMVVYEPTIMIWMRWFLKVVYRKCTFPEAPHRIISQVSPATAFGVLMLQARYFSMRNTTFHPGVKIASHAFAQVNVDQFIASVRTEAIPISKHTIKDTQIQKLFVCTIVVHSGKE